MSTENSLQRFLDRWRSLDLPTEEKLRVVSVGWMYRLQASSERLSASIIGKLADTQTPERGTSTPATVKAEASSSVTTRGEALVVEEKHGWQAVENRSTGRGWCTCGTDARGGNGQPLRSAIFADEGDRLWGW